MGIALAETKRAAWLCGCAVMLVAIPVASQVLPQALAAWEAYERLGFESSTPGART